MAGIKFSDYVGLNHYKKAKKLKHFIHLRLPTWPQSLSTYHIHHLQMIVKIGIIFMPFSNPTCHFKGTADYTCLQSSDG